MVGFVLIQLQLPLQHAQATVGNKGGDLFGTKSFISDPVAVVACTIVQMKFRKKANSHTTICFVFKFRPEFWVTNNTNDYIYIYAI
jgi:hypothetical protein